MASPHAANSGVTQPAESAGYSALLHWLRDDGLVHDRADNESFTSPLDWPCFARSRDSAPTGCKTFFKTPSSALGRQMTEWASTADENLFPLLVHHLCDVKTLLVRSPHNELLTSAPNLAVSLERISRIPDPNQRGQPRTDFFVYWESGEIPCFHPSRDPQKEAKAHTMTPMTCLIDQNVLPVRGAGAALHAHPPGNVHQLASHANPCDALPDASSKSMRNLRFNEITLAC